MFIVLLTACGQNAATGTNVRGRQAGDNATICRPDQQWAEPTSATIRLTVEQRLAGGPRSSCVVFRT